MDKTACTYRGRMEFQAGRQGYLAQQRARIELDLTAAQARVEACRITIANAYPVTEQAAEKIQSLWQAAIADARRQCIRKACRGSWRAALSLLAMSHRNHWLLLMQWLLVVLGAPLFVMGLHHEPMPLHWLQQQINPFNWFHPTLPHMAMLATYLSLVLFGLTVETAQRTQGQRQGFKFLAALKLRLLHFSEHESRDPHFPYLATRAPWPDQQISARWKIAAEFGCLYDADFVSFHAGESATDPCFLLLLAADPGKATPIAIKLDEGEPYWNSWQPLLRSMAPSMLPLVAPVRGLATSAEALEREASQVASLRQRLKTLDGVAAEWADVAIHEQTLDQILKLVDLFVSGRKPSPKGMLLYGPPGTGKTLIARNLAKYSGCHFESVGIADLKGQHVGHTGPRIKELWQRCRAKSPCILFIDECESVFARRGGVDSDAFGAELIQTFLSEWDGFNEASGLVLVIGATNRRDILDDAVMSRFTTSIAIGLPNADFRRRILHSEFRRAGLSIAIDEGMLRDTSGMSGRDIHTLVAGIVAEHLGNELDAAAFSTEVRRLRGKSSAQVQSLTWDDVVLPKATREEFTSLGKELRNAEQLRSLNIHVPRGILLYGPPGTGKTQIARVLASQSELSFLIATTADLKGSFIGHSGQSVKALFEKARTQAPSILFVDEIDVIAPARGHNADDGFTREIVGQFLQELDGATSHDGQIFLLAASNHPDHIDAALLSRMERKIEIELPDAEARAAIIGLQLRDKPVSFDIDEVAQWLAERTAGLSGRDLQSLVTQATRRAVRRVLAVSDDALATRLEREDLEHAWSERRLRTLPAN